MKKQRSPFRKRRHTPEFKVECVRVMRERLATGLTLQRVSEELEVEPDLLRKWAKYVASAPAGAAPAEICPGHGQRRRTGSPPAGDVARSPEEELRHLRRENERLRMERDFLKKGSSRNSGERRADL
jgi:transposase